MTQPRSSLFHAKENIRNVIIIMILVLVGLCWVEGRVAVFTTDTSSPIDQYNSLFGTPSLHQQRIIRENHRTRAVQETTDDGDAENYDSYDYTSLFVDTLPRLSLFDIHKIISARFVSSSYNDFLYLPSKLHSTMTFYFLTVVTQSGFVKIDCDFVFNSLKPMNNGIFSTLVLGKYSLEEEKVVWAARQGVEFLFGKPFAYVTHDDQIIITCNTKDDKGFYSKVFYKINGDSDTESSFQYLTRSKEVNIVMEGEIDLFNSVVNSTLNEGYIIYGSKKRKDLNSLYDSKKETLHYESSLISTFYSNGNPRWNVKIAYKNDDVFEMINMRIQNSTNNQTDPLFACFNYIGTGDLKVFDSNTDDFVRQKGYLDGSRYYYRLKSMYSAAGFYLISYSGVLREIFTLRTYPANNSTASTIYVKNFYLEQSKGTFIVLAYVNGMITFSRGEGGNNTILWPRDSYTDPNQGQFVLIKFTYGKEPSCISVPYIDDNPIITYSYYINKRISIPSPNMAVLHLEVFDTTSGTLKDSARINITCDNPLGLSFDVFYEKRRYLAIKGTSQSDNAITINGRYKIFPVKNQQELVFMLYLNTHPRLNPNSFSCTNSTVVCRENDGDNICNLHGSCMLSGSCSCETWYNGRFCENHFYYQFFIISSTIGFVVLTMAASGATFSVMFAQNVIKKRLHKLRKKEQAEEELERKLLEYVGLQISDNTFDLKSWIIPFDQLIIDSEISEQDGKVILKGTWKGTNVAIKKVRLQESIEYIEENHELNLDKSLEREASILSRVRHPNIVRFWGLCFTHTDQFLITELFNHRLDKVIDDINKSKLYLPVQVKVQIMHDVACAMTYLHEFDPPILHRNLKTENIMLCEEQKFGKVITTTKPKIADFGLSTHFREDNALTKEIGTALYSDPLIFKGERYSEKCDVYSFSIVMYELFFETEPYKASKKVGEIKEQFNQTILPMKIVEGYRPKVPFTKTLESIGDWMEENLEMINERIIDPEYLAKSIQVFIELMKKCWSGDQNERPSFRAIQETLSQVLKGEIAIN